MAQDGVLTFVVKLSIASSVVTLSKSGGCPALIMYSPITQSTSESPHSSKSSPPAPNFQSSTRASTSTHGATRSKNRLHAVTLGTPTSASVATACRLSEDSVTISKSTRRMREMPLLHQVQI